MCVCVGGGVIRLNVTEKSEILKYLKKKDFLAVRVKTA